MKKQALQNDASALPNFFSNFKLWKKSMLLLEKVYILLQRLPASERYLADQIRRSVIAIPSHIAEAKYHRSQEETKRFFRLAHASTAEVKTQLAVVQRMQWCSQDEFQEIELILRQLLRALDAVIRYESSSDPVDSPCR